MYFLTIIIKWKEQTIHRFSTAMIALSFFKVYLKKRAVLFHNTVTWEIYSLTFEESDLTLREESGTDDWHGGGILDYKKNKVVML